MDRRKPIEYNVQPSKNAKISVQQGRGSRLASSKAQLTPPKQLILRFDINTLLSLFNEMQTTGSQQIQRRGVKKIMDAIGLYHMQQYLYEEMYTFDHFLSVLGEIQVPQQPSIYVLSFVKILAHYRDKCLLNDNQGLEEAKEVQEKIRKITQNQIDRQKQRIKAEHSKIFEDMHISQQKQFSSFEEEWKNYLKQFRQETTRRLQQTRYQRKAKIAEQENKFITKARNSSVITSPRLNELIEKKRWLIKDKKYQNAIQIGNQISRERERLSYSRDQANQVILNKKIQNLALKTNGYIGFIQKNLQVNLNRLISKKKQGESIMKIRMKNLREQANRKLNEHYRSEVNRLRSSFYLAANH